MIDAIALWNEESSGIETMAIATSVDGVNFSSVASGITPVNNQSDWITSRRPSPSLARAARYVRLTLTGPQNEATFTAVSIGEVAFRQSGVIQPPSGYGSRANVARRVGTGCRLHGARRSPSSQRVS